jgi:long-subunit fatty acid transport protein
LIDIVSGLLFSGLIETKCKLIRSIKENIIKDLYLKSKYNEVLMRFLSLILLISLFIGSLSADSIFSYNGFPEKHYAVDAYSAGMGNASVSDTYRMNAGYENPAILANISRVVFSTAVTFGYYEFDDGNSTFSEEGVYFPYFSIGVPLADHRIGFTFSPYLSGNFDSQKSGKLDESANSNSDVNYTVISKLHANIYKASMMYAYDFEFLQFGIGANYYTGNRMRFHHWDFEDGSFVDTKEEVDMNFQGAGLTLGFTKSFENLSLGFAYQSYAKLATTLEHISLSSTTDMDVDDFELPHSITLGATYKITPKFKISSDLSYEMWEQLDNAEYKRDAFSLKGGLAYDPKWGYGYWYEKIPLRVGGFYQKNPFKVLDADSNERTLIEKGFTLGMSIPLSTPDKQIHLGFKYSIRDGENTTSKDTNTLFTVGVTGFDFFKKRLKRTGHRDIPKADK